MIRNTNSSERNPMYLTRKPSELMGTSIPRSSREGLFTPAAGNTDDLMAILPTGDHLAEFAALGDSWGGVTELSSSRMLHVRGGTYVSEAWGGTFDVALPRSAPTDTPSIGAGEGDVVWAVSVGQ
jgi:hypothetical protein